MGRLPRRPAGLFGRLARRPNGEERSRYFLRRLHSLSVNAFSIQYGICARRTIIQSMYCIALLIPLGRRRTYFEPSTTKQQSTGHVHVNVFASCMYCRQISPPPAPPEKKGVFGWVLRTEFGIRFLCLRFLKGVALAK